MKISDPADNHKIGKVPCRKSSESLMNLENWEWTLSLSFLASTKVVLIHTKHNESLHHHVM